jgi:lipopolysaccharide biosynthesis glycosyltransferase
MNLIYACVFHQESYINLLKLLITSISVKSNINKDTTDILIITSPSFKEKIVKELEGFDLPLYYYILDLHTLMEASCCKLKIFQYHNIEKYQKLLYLDTDVLINSDVNILFNIEISEDKLYTLEEGIIGNDLWGGPRFFDFTKFDRNTPAFSAGVFYFMNSLSMKKLFEDTNKHIANHLANNYQIPVCLDQPFLVYNSFISNKYDNQFMKKYLENNPNEVSNEKIIYHFPGGPGHYSSKYYKMTHFWNLINAQSNI